MLVTSEVGRVGKFRAGEVRGNQGLGRRATGFETTLATSLLCELGKVSPDCIVTMERVTILILQMGDEARENRDGLLQEHLDGYVTGSSLEHFVISIHCDDHKQGFTISCSQHLEPETENSRLEPRPINSRLFSTSQQDGDDVKLDQVLQGSRNHPL